MLPPVSPLFLLLLLFMLACNNVDKMADDVVVIPAPREMLVTLSPYAVPVTDNHCVVVSASSIAAADEDNRPCPGCPKGSVAVSIV